jgi:hypothetical protein
MRSGGLIASGACAGPSGALTSRRSAASGVKLVARALGHDVRWTIGAGSRRERGVTEWVLRILEGRGSLRIARAPVRNVAKEPREEEWLHVVRALRHDGAGSRRRAGRCSGCSEATRDEGRLNRSSARAKRREGAPLQVEWLHVARALRHDGAGSRRRAGRCSGCSEASRAEGCCESLGRPCETSRRSAASGGVAARRSSAPT